MLTVQAKSHATVPLCVIAYHYFVVAERGETEKPRHSAKGTEFLPLVPPAS